MVLGLMLTGRVLGLTFALNELLQTIGELFYGTNTNMDLMRRIKVDQ